jgi:hypothetical protein
MHLQTNKIYCFGHGIVQEVWKFKPFGCLSERRQYVTWTKNL